MRDGAASLRIELFADDLERSVDFYTRVLGFARATPAAEAAADYCAVRLGTCTIGIGLDEALPGSHPLRSRGRERRGVGVEIVIEVDDVEAAHRRAVEAGWPVLTPLSDRPWGLRDFRMLDPDGYYIRVTSR